MNVKIDNYINNNDIEGFKLYIINAKSVCTAVAYANKSVETSNFIISITPFVPNDSTIYYRLMMILHNINTYDDLPRCKNCNKILGDKDIRKYFLQNNQCFCSRECYNSFPKSLETLLKISMHMKKQWENRDETYKKNFYEKVAQTNITRYGTKCTLNTEENIQKKTNTWLKKYGVDNPLKSSKIWGKIKETSLKLYGVESPNSADIVKQHKVESILKKYGVESTSLLEEVKDKVRLTCLLKYGMDWGSKTEESWQKQCATIEKNVFIRPKYKKYKIYKYPSGKEVIVLGYEDIALDSYILKLYNEDNIENSISFMNSLNIKYNDNNGNIHRYIPDFYIKSENLIIEVKSAFTFYTDLDIILKKVKAALDAQYNILVIVFEHINRKKLNIKYKIYNYEDIKIEKERISL